MATEIASPTANETAEVTLPVVGMTCASCVNRIERFLSRADGVDVATVNLATERATVRFDPALIDRAGIVSAIESAGYDVGRDTASGEAVDLASAEAADEAERAAERRELLTGAIASVGIGLTMMAIMFWPGGTPWPMMDVNRWFIAPATSVQFIFGRRFLVAAARGLRHGDLNMNTLVAMGTLAAYGYSMVVTLLPELLMGAGVGHETYFDSAAVIHSAAELEGAISHAPADGMTALYAAIVKALEHLQSGNREKKVLLVISDGSDNASKHKLAQVLELAEQSNAIIYAIGLSEKTDPDHNPGVLKRLAHETGGEAYFPAELSEVVDVCENIARDIRTQYAIGYFSSNATSEKAYRRIRVAARAEGRGKLSVRTRAGYMARGESPRRQSAP
jgi:copper chaperone CopZ